MTDYAGQYNNIWREYNQFLYASFANNQTLINDFMRWPISAWPEVVQQRCAQARCQWKDSGLSS